MPPNDFLSVSKDALAALLVELVERNPDGHLTVSYDQFNESIQRIRNLRVTRMPSYYKISVE